MSLNGSNGTRRHARGRLIRAAQTTTTAAATTSTKNVFSAAATDPAAAAPAAAAPAASTTACAPGIIATRLHVAAASPSSASSSSPSSSDQSAQSLHIRPGAPRLRAAPGRNLHRRSESFGKSERALEQMLGKVRASLEQLDLQSETLAHTRSSLQALVTRLVRVGKVLPSDLDGGERGSNTDATSARAATGPHRSAAAVGVNVPQTLVLNLAHHARHQVAIGQQWAETMADIRRFNGEVGDLRAIGSHLEETLRVQAKALELVSHHTAPAAAVNATTTTSHGPGNPPGHQEKDRVDAEGPAGKAQSSMLSTTSNAIADPQQQRSAQTESPADSVVRLQLQLQELQALAAGVIARIRGQQEFSSELLRDFEDHADHGVAQCQQQSRRLDPSAHDARRRNQPHPPVVGDAVLVKLCPLLRAAPSFGNAVAAVKSAVSSACRGIPCVRWACGARYSPLQSGGPVTTPQKLDPSSEESGDHGAETSTSPLKGCGASSASGAGSQQASAAHNSPSTSDDEDAPLLVHPP